MKYSPIERFESKACPGVVVTLRKMSPALRDNLMLATAPQQQQAHELLMEMADMPDCDPVRYAPDDVKAAAGVLRTRGLFNPFLAPDYVAKVVGENPPSEQEIMEVNAAIGAVCAFVEAASHQPSEYRNPQESEKARYVNLRLAGVDLRTTKAYVAAVVKSISGLTIESEDGTEREATIQDVIDGGPDELFDELSKEVRRLMGLTAVQEKNSSSPTTSGAPEGGTTEHSGAASAESPATT
jgi:hypothetical protein